MSLLILYRVLVGWSGRNAGVFVLDTLPGLDEATFGQYQFTVNYAGSDDNVTQDVLDFKTVCGRDNMLDRMKASTLDMHLHDEGKYNPRNSSSVLYRQVGRPMRPVRVDCSLDGGATYPYVLFQGWGRTGDSNPNIGTQIANFHAEDIYMWLQRAFPVIADTGPTTTGAALGLVLDSIGFSDPASRSLDTGDYIPNFGADGTVDGLTLVNNLLLAEQGIFFHAPSGVVVYRSRNSWIGRASLGTIALAETAVPGWDLDKIKNTISVTRQYPDPSNPGQMLDGVPQVAVNDASKNEFGAASDTPITTPYLSTDARAAGLGAWIVDQAGEPTDRIWSVGVVEGPAGYVTIMLSGMPGDHVVLTDPTAPGDYTVERIEHSGASGKLHSTKWGLSLRPTILPFLLDTSMMDDAPLTY